MIFKTEILVTNLTLHSLYCCTALALDFAVDQSATPHAKNSEFTQDRIHSERVVSGLVKATMTYFQNCSIFKSVDRSPTDYLRQSTSTRGPSCTNRANEDLSYQRNGISRLAKFGGETRIDARGRFWCSGLTGTSECVIGCNEQQRRFEPALVAGSAVPAAGPDEVGSASGQD